MIDFICPKCGNPGTRAKSTTIQCQACKVEYHKEYYQKNRVSLREQGNTYWSRQKTKPAFIEKERKRGREYWRKIRDEAIKAYGGYICRCCRETEPKFLGIDHMFDDGADHRREMGYGTGIAGWLKKRGYPPGYQVLCHNCNLGRALNKGICPHQEARSTGKPRETGEVQTGLSRTIRKGLALQNLPF